MPWRSRAAAAIPRYDHSVTTKEAWRWKEMAGFPLQESRPVLTAPPLLCSLTRPDGPPAPAIAYPDRSRRFGRARGHKPDEDGLPKSGLREPEWCGGRNRNGRLTI